MFPNKQTEKYYLLCDELLSFESLSWWIIDLEDDPNIFYCNKAMCKTFSLDETIIKHSVSDTCPIAGDYNTNVAIKSSAKASHIFDEYHQLRKGIIHEYNNTFPYYNDALNEVLYFSSRAKVLVKGASGKATLLFGIIEPEKVSAELYKMSKTDSLTGLTNRREFDDKLEFLTNLAGREKHHISLIMCDIDYFKQYNDSLGHYAGDECLIRVAQSISNTCRRTTEVVCRYGGEEFAIIVYNDINQASYIAEAIRKQVYTMGIPHPARDNKAVTLSIGYCSMIPSANSSNKKLIEAADEALYEAKSSGRNVCVQYKS